MTWTTSVAAISPRPESERQPAQQAARQFITTRFPVDDGAQSAYLAGSAGRGRATATSDLDIVVVQDEGAPYRRTLRYEGWPVELFVHTEESLAEFYRLDARRGVNTLADMVSSGIVLRGGRAARTLQSEAREWVEAGPRSTQAAIDKRRYELTDRADDLRGGGDPDEMLATATLVYQQAAELWLLGHGHWIGGGKWLMRRLRDFDAEGAQALSESFRDAVASGDYRGLLDYADAALLACGGPLTDGFSVGDAPPETA